MPETITNEEIENLINTVDKIYLRGSVKRDYWIIQETANLISSKKDAEIKELKSEFNKIYKKYEEEHYDNIELKLKLENSIPKPEILEAIGESRISTDIGIIIDEIKLRQRLKL